MTELEIIALVMPTLLLVAVGWVIVRVGLFSADDADVLSTLFLHVCAPALIVAHLAKQDLAALIEPAFILATLFLTLVLYAGSIPGAVGNSEARGRPQRLCGLCGNKI